MDALDPRIQTAVTWLMADSDDHLLDDQEHCPSRDVFAARLDSFRLVLETQPAHAATGSLVIAVLGELGNNAFDHNLGTWRDTPGVYFVYDLADRLVVIADRGQGVLASLQRVVPSLVTDQQAVETAFTQVISGRSPEQRGNGLKFVAAVASEANLSLSFYSGTGQYHLGTARTDLSLARPLHGVLAIVHF